MPIIQVKNIAKAFEEGNAALHPTSFEIEARKKLAIVGETGSGKSTLLKIIGGRLQPDRGEVYFKNEKVKGPEEQLIPGHPKIAYMSQHFELPKFVTVGNYLEDLYTLSEAGAFEIYEACRIDHLLDKDTMALSGGEKQRVALAKILCGQPEVLLLDEPYSNLDIQHNITMKEVLNAISVQLEITCLMVSHNPLDVLPWADELMVLHHGVCVQSGSPKSLYYQPKSTYVAGLFGKFNLLKAKDWPGIDEASDQVNGHFIIRPELFQVNKKESSHYRGEITNISFNGSFDEVKIKVNNQELIAFVEVGRFKEGEQVFVSL